MARLKRRVSHAQSNNVLLRRVCIWGGLIAWLLSVPPAHAAIAVIATETAGDSSNNASSLTVAVPSGTADGDVLLAHISTRDGTTITAPAGGGWMLVAATSQSVGGGRNVSYLAQAVYYRVAASEPASYTWGVSGRTAGAIVALSGVDTTAGIVDDSTAASASGSVSPAAVTTAQVNSLLLGFFSGMNGSVTFTSPAGMSDVALIQSGGGPNGTSNLITSESIAASGSTGSRTADSGEAATLGTLLALSPAALGVSLNYQISAPANAVTCEPVNVTITATNSSGVATDIPGGTTISVSTDVANDGWTNPDGASSYQYTLPADAASVTFQLRKLSPATLEIDVSGSDGGNDDDGNQNDDFVTFSDAAFRFYGDGVVDSVNTQIAGRGTSMSGEAITVRAVHTDPATGACEALISNGSAAINMAYDCVSPASCATANDGLIVSGSAGDISIDADTVGYTTVSIAFDGTGTGSLDFRYDDAGRIQLLATAILPVSDTDPAGGSVTVSGASNSFVVRPAGFCIVSNEANASCSAPHEDCTVLARAGETFELSVTAVGWQSDGEIDTDFCAGNATTPNFAVSDIPLSHALVAPSGGATGSLGTSTVSISSGGTATFSQSVSEVGAFTFSVDGVSDYLSAADADLAAASSATIGRIVPYAFGLSGATVSDANGGFTYLGQSFGLSFLVTARNSAGGTTTNYTDVFARLTAGDFSFGAVGSAPVSSFNPRLSSTSSVSWNNGLASVTTQMTIARAAAPEAASSLANIAIGGLAADTEGAFTITTSGLDLDTNVDGIDDSVALGMTDQRFGRLYVQSASGPESAALAVPFRTEYWNGSTWTASSSDETRIVRTAIEFTDSDGSAANILSDPILAPLGSAPYPAVSWTYSPAGLAYIAFGDGLGGGSGDAGLSVAAPGVVDYFDIDVDLSSYPWLQFDWDQDGDYNDADDFGTPTIRVRFETFRGNDRILYWREVF